MRKEKIIIFDFDGVIADSFEITFSIVKASRPTLTRARYRKQFDGNIYDALFKDLVLTEIDFFPEYGRRFKTLGIRNEVKAIIKKLSHNFCLFVVSNTTGSIIKEYLERHEILDCFTEILGSEIETSKVKKFNMIFEKYKILPAETIFITDSAGDIKEAKAAKINFIVGILGGYQGKASLEKAEPKMIAENFNDFYNLIQRW